MSEEDDQRPSKLRTASSKEVRGHPAGQRVIVSSTLLDEIGTMEQHSFEDDGPTPVSSGLPSMIDDENNQTDTQKIREGTKMPEEKKIKQPNRLVYLVGAAALAVSLGGNYHLHKKNAGLEAELESKPAVEQLTSLQSENVSLLNKYKDCTTAKANAENDYSKCQRLNDALKANPLPFADSWYDRIRRNIRNEAEIEVIVNEFLKMTREKHLLLQNPSNLFHVMCSEYRNQKEYNQLHGDFDYAVRKIFDIPNNVPPGKHIVLSY